MIPSDKNSPTTSRFLVLTFLVYGLMLLLLTGGLLWLVQDRPQTSAETLVGLLSILTLLVLGFAVGTLGFVLRRAGRQPLLPPLLLTLLLAYLLPAGVYFGMDYLLTSRPAGLQPSLPAVGLRPSLFPGQPWLFLWQALILTFLNISTAAPAAAKNSPASRALPPVWLSGLLGGGSIALLMTYLFSITRAWLESSLAAANLTQPLEIAPLIRWTTLLIGILIAPWAEERFFRGELIHRWQSRLGLWGAAFASAGLFATLQFRPLLWLPAFLAGLALAWLANAHGSLKPAILAHAVINGLLFVLGWQWMI
ncbi:MAG: CPBP family intramembrane glutamic endopeptidase [Chloroflexota bacterium]